MDKNEGKIEVLRVEEQEDQDQVVNPWQVSSKGKIDYDKLIDQFGCQRLDTSLIDRVQRLTGRPLHVFLRRSVFFAHRFDPEVFFVDYLFNLFPVQGFLSFCEMGLCETGILVRY